MWAHFLTAETADALFIIVDRRISAAVIKADSFPFHRAALDADAAFFTFFFYDIGAALEDPKDLKQVEGSFFAGFAAVDVEVWISVLSFQFFLGYGAIRCHDFDAVVVPRSKAERFPVEICRHIRRIEVHQMAEHSIQCDRIGGHKKNSHRNRVAGSRTIAFHCYDAVADIKARGDFLVQLDQHVCEALSVRILRVAEFFVDAADAAVLVLDSSGDAFQRVGFHFADADEGVAVECIFRNHQKFAIGGFYALARKEILQKGLEAIGGLESLIGKEENILLKPNLVRSAKRERAVVTDPEVMDALITILQENGYENISCGDSCGLGTPEGIAKEAGLKECWKNTTFR